MMHGIRPSKVLGPSFIFNYMKMKRKRTSVSQMCESETKWIELVLER